LAQERFKRYETNQENNQILALRISDIHYRYLQHWSHYKALFDLLKVQSYKREMKGLREGGIQAEMG
jgi:hypothetical protein